MNYIIEAKGISKKYRIGEKEKYLTFRDTLADTLSRAHNLFKKQDNPLKEKEFWAVKDASFRVEEGQVFGVVGPNGSGKSTLLKILSRITAPTAGEVIIKGRVGSLLEVGTGFHQELTGRENIFLNGAILGMKRKEIRKKFDEIVDFSGIEKFLDMPVKRYSSGMYVRLAFSIAAHLDPEILLVDEVLSVGDTEFQRKSMRKMGTIAKSGRTILFVSHNLNSVKALCSEGIFLKNGKVKYVGKIEETIEEYSTSIVEQSDLDRSFEGNLKEYIRINSIKINGQSGNLATVNPFEKLKFEIEGTSKKNMAHFRFTLSIFKDDARVFTLHDVKDYSKNLKSGKFKVVYEIEKNMLRPGRFYIAFGGHKKSAVDYFWGPNVMNLIVSDVWSPRNEEINIGLINLSDYHAHRQN